uniref:Si:ch211-262i1.6 n=1 Tax=Neogobius melanostomus TaxID=47308 RepID=A0A8C6U877_9GOBI
MSLSGLVPAVLLSACCCWMLVLAAEEKPPLPSAGPGAAAAKAPGNSSSPAVNSTSDSGGKQVFVGFNVDSSMIQRALYVLIGITLTGLLYFLIRAVRLKKPAPKKKYGLLSDYDDSVEMEGVESEEDDTLYEARGLRR